MSESGRLSTRPLETRLGRRRIPLGADVAVGHARSRRDETAHDDVFLQAAQGVDAAGARGPGEDQRLTPSDA
jgi:hypothetical protein